MSVGNIVGCVTELTALFGMVVAAMIWANKLINGVKCQLRTDMLKIYYNNSAVKKLRQYEYENFMYNYEAYKALKGNSFIDKIYSEVIKWEIVT